MPMPKKKAARVVPSSMAALRGNLEKRYGNRVVRRDEMINYEVISTGSLTLDLALRVGGWVLGRMNEIVGPEGVGKTTLVISSMVEAQRASDLAVAYIDMEQTFDYAWAESLGLDTSEDRFVHIFPDHAEDVSDMLRQTTETGLFWMVVVDSIGAMESQQALEKEGAEVTMGRNAQVITRMVKNCAVLARRNRVTVLLVNQLRANLSGMGQDQSAGPKALKYSTTVKVEMKPTFEEPIKYRYPGDKEDVIISRMCRATVSRSKVSVQGGKAEFYLINYDTPEYGPVGIDKVDEAINVGISTGVIEQGGGGYYTFPSTSAESGSSRVRGRDKVADHLRSCPDDLEIIRARALATMSGDVIEETETSFEHAGAEA